MMEFPITEPQVGRQYWWLTRNARGPLVVEVLEIIPKGYNLRINNHDVTWTTDEWNHAVTANSLTDYLAPITQDDLLENEELCQMCHGTRWEHTRDSEILVCMWCKFTGKRTKSTPPAPTHARRSPLHPEVPIQKQPCDTDNICRCCRIGNAVAGDEYNRCVRCQDMVPGRRGDWRQLGIYDG